jgi:hypothetical protein
MGLPRWSREARQGKGCLRHDRGEYQVNSRICGETAVGAAPNGVFGCWHGVAVAIVGGLLREAPGVCQAALAGSVSGLRLVLTTW